MKHSVLICARRDPDILTRLATSLVVRNTFPDQFTAETVGSGTVCIRMELDCTPEAMSGLQTYWRSDPTVQSVVVTEELQPAYPFPKPAVFSD